jgi:hypothetical protein
VPNQRPPKTLVLPNELAPQPDQRQLQTFDPTTGPGVTTPRTANPGGNNTPVIPTPTIPVITVPSIPDVTVPRVVVPTPTPSPIPDPGLGNVTPTTRRNRGIAE